MNLVPFSTISKGASEKKMGSTIVFMFRLVANLTDMKATKIVGLLIETNEEEKSAKEGSIRKKNSLSFVPFGAFFGVLGRPVAH